MNRRKMRSQTQTVGTYSMWGTSGIYREQLMNGMKCSPGVGVHGAVCLGVLFKPRLGGLSGEQ